jgi:hypothetical protein
MPGREGAAANRSATPVEVLVQGAAAGLAATLLLSALSRALPGLWNERSQPGPGGRGGNGGGSALPENPSDPEQLQEWQDRTRSPAAFPEPGSAPGEAKSGPPAVQPAGALAKPRGPGPEGLAEQFAFKVASGIFNRDLSPHLRPVGMATHLAYGSAWGALYGLVQASYRLHPGLFGLGFGALVYGIGPALLVPKMGIMKPPGEEPPERTWMLLAGHAVYGMAVAEVFDALERRDG